jgi:hypothetical protein
MLIGIWCVDVRDETKAMKNKKTLPTCREVLQAWADSPDDHQVVLDEWHPYPTVDGSFVKVCSFTFSCIHFPQGRFTTVREFLAMDGLAKVAEHSEDPELKDLVRPTLHFGFGLSVGFVWSISSGKRGTAFSLHVDSGQTDSLSVQIEGVKGWIGVKAKDEAALKKLVVKRKYVMISNLLG